MCFVAAEVEQGCYLLDPQELKLPILHREEGRGQRTEPPDSDDDMTGSTVEHADRIFFQNPLHDYESVWWIAVWFVFHSEPEGVTEDVMEEARDRVYRNRSSSFFSGSFKTACRSLPEVLRPLGETLVEMKRLLVYAYTSFEESFDGSEMLDIFPNLRRCLQLLARRAQGLDVTTPGFRRTLNAEEVKQFDAVALGWEQRGEGQPKDAGDPSIRDGMLGKRTRTNSSPEIHVAKRGKFEDRLTVAS